MGAIERWITGRLEADAPIIGMLGAQPASTGGDPGIYSPAAPKGAAPPYIVIGDPAGGGDSYSSDGPSSHTRIVPVRAVVQAESAIDAEALADRIDALLSGQTPTGTGYRFGILRRVGFIAYSEDRDGVAYIHRGGRYGTLVIPTD